MIKIKVLHLISGNDYGGGATYVLNICKAPNNMFENCLCCIGDGPLYKISKESGIETVKLSMKAIIKGGLLSLIESSSIDLINFHGAKANFIYYFIKKSISVPTAVTVHSDYRYDFINSKIKQLFFTPLNILGLKSFKNYVCVSNYILKLLKDNNFKGNKVVIENGIDINKYKLSINSDEMKEKYKIGDNDFLFVMVARMHPIKNHSSLLKAFKKLKLEFGNIKLMLVGDGSLLEELIEEAVKENLKDAVIFTGFQNNSLDYFNVCDISILPSFSEGGSPPLVVLESGIANKPVICSNIGDISDIINDNMGYLIDPNSLEDIYNKMKEAYLNKAMLSKMGKELNKIVINNYSIEKFWHKYYNFYDKLLQSNYKNNR